MNHLWITAIYCAMLIGISQCQNTVDLTFPENFIIGVGTAAYQVEGGWNASDKGENTWDYFTHNTPEYIVDGSNGDVAGDSYHKWEEDVEWIKELGLDFYRFSLSWSRILPTGFADKVSQDGIQYYRNLTEALLANNITPIVTMYHWDHPQILEEMGGWTNEMMVEWYADYARVVFEELGDLVKVFLTMNEPNILCWEGYNKTMKAPGKILENMGHYICAHNVLKAHAVAYHMYDEEFRTAQEGQIGLTISCNGFVEGEGTSDATFTQMFQFYCGWIAHPIYIGDYPEIVKTRVALMSEMDNYPFSRLPEFTEDWIEYIKGTADFLGINHYTSRMPVYDPDEELGIYTKDSGLIYNVNESWSRGASDWLYVTPDGLGNVLRMIRDQYDNPPVYMFENGYTDTGELDDYARISYFYDYLSDMLKAIKEDGCNVLGYTIWALIDTYEWDAGYTEKFGIIKVDFDSDDRTRTAKLSKSWWQEVIRTRELQPVPTSS